MARERVFYESQQDVTVCGILQEDSVWVDKEDTVKIEHGKPGSFMDASLKYKKKVFKRTLRVGYALRHKDDMPYEEFGKELSKKRAFKNPLGVIETNNITMLQPEDVQALLKSKAEYIRTNIEKFIKKNR